MVLANPDVEAARLNRLIAGRRIDVCFAGIGENCHLAFNDPPANFDTEVPYIIVTLDEACRRQQHREGWFPTFEAVPKQAISMSVAADYGERSHRALRLRCPKGAGRP